MEAIAVQSAIGNSGEKPVTKFTDFTFNSLGMINNFPVGVNSTGLFLLNIGDKDNNISFKSTFVLATTDFNLNEFKRLRYIYIGVNTNDSFIISIAVDDSDWIDYLCEITKEGLQKIRIPISRKTQGRYWKIKVTSDYWFRIDYIEILPIVRSTGIGGGH